MAKFKNLLHRKIEDSAEEFPGEFLENNPDAELEEVTEKVKKLEQILIEETSGREHLDEDMIDSMEWKEIYQAINNTEPSLLDDLGIKNYRQLAEKFTGKAGYTTKARLVSNEIFDDYLKKGKFSKRAIKKLSRGAKSELMHQIIEHKITIPFDIIPFSEIANLSGAEFFCRQIAFTHPEKLILDFESYAGKDNYWAFSVLYDVFCKLPEDKFEMLLKESNVSKENRESIKKMEFREKRDDVNTMYERYLYDHNNHKRFNEDFSRFYNHEVVHMSPDAQKALMNKFAEEMPQRIYNSYFSLQPPPDSDVLITALLKDVIITGEMEKFIKDMTSVQDMEELLKDMEDFYEDNKKHETNPDSNEDSEKDDENSKLLKKVIMIHNLKKIEYAKITLLTNADIETYLQIETWVATGAEKLKLKLNVRGMLKLGIDVAFELNRNKNEVNEETEVNPENVNKAIERRAVSFRAASQLLGPQGESGNIETLLANPALGSFWEIDLDWLSAWQLLLLGSTGSTTDSIGLVGDRERLHIQAMIALDLYFQHKEINEKNVVEEADRIIECRTKFGDVNAIQGVYFVIAAGNEKLKKEDYDKNNAYKEYLGYTKEDWDKIVEEDDNHSVPESIPKKIKEMGGEIPNGVVRAKNDTREAGEIAGENILNGIREAPLSKPLHILFQGHGDWIKNKGGEIFGLKISENYAISLEKIYAAYKFRQEAMSAQENRSNQLDFLNLTNCDNANAFRMFGEWCERDGIQKPIMMGDSARYGQSVMANFKSPYRSKVLDQLFGDDGTLGNLMRFDWEDTSFSDHSLFIPDEQGRTKQIAEREKNKTIKSADDEIKALEDELGRVA